MGVSILDSTKKLLGVSADYDVFDTDIVMHINTAIATLTQLGVGPDTGFLIEDADSTWEEFLGADPRFNAAKSYVYLRVRMLFDPPTTSFLLDAFQKQMQEMEWRLNVQREHDDWVDPNPPVPVEDVVMAVSSVRKEV